MSYKEKAQEKYVLLCDWKEKHGVSTAKDIVIVPGAGVIMPKHNEDSVPGTGSR